MIVSDTERFIFIHNPKCAGMAIRSCLLHYDTSKNYFSGYKMFGGEKLGMAHLPLWKLNHHFPHFIDQKMRQYYTFAVVRNPFTRTVAAFNMIGTDHYLKFKETGDLDEYRSSLNAFIENLDTGKINSFEYEHRHFTRQADYVYFREERMPETVLTFELLPQDIAKMSWMNAVVAHRLLTNLKRLNTRHVIDDTTSLLTEASKDMIRRVYEKDFELFGYSVA
jgi:hypothetical protein